MFYGWKISGLCLGGNLMLQGAALYCVNAFLEPLCDANDWSRASVNFSLGLAALMGQIAMPWAAAVSQKRSLRLLMGLGALVGGLATCCMGITSSLAVFSALLILLWVSSQFCGAVVGNALMSNWFSHYRGIALGIANSGTTLAGFVLPMGCLVLIHEYGLVVAYLALGLATCLLAPLCWRFVADTPQQMGLWPDGRKHAPRHSHTRNVNVAWKSLLRNPAAWAIGVAFGLALMTGSGVMSQIKPRFSDLGLDHYTAMWLACGSALFGVGAKYFWGYVCDRITPVKASKLLMGACFLSMLLSWLPPSLWSMAAFGFCFFSSLGGAWVVLPAVTAYYFGAENFLGAYKLISIFILLRCLGFPAMGLSWDVCASYDLADLIFSISLFVALVLVLQLHDSDASEARKHGSQQSQVQATSEAFQRCESTLK